MGFNSGFKGLKAQHVSSGTPLIIRSSKLYLQPLVYMPIWWSAVAKAEWALSAHSALYSWIRASQYESAEITNKMQPCNRIYYSKIYWKLIMFRAASRSSSGALNCICSLWFTYCNKVKDFVYIIDSPYLNITMVIRI